MKHGSGLDPEDIDKLCEAMQRARLVLRKPREERVDAVRQYVGPHWSEEGAEKTVPCNLLSLYVSIVGRKLIANNPRVLLSTWDRPSRPVVAAMNDWVNERIQKINLAETMQRVVLDAMFSIGICKVCLASPADSALTGFVTKPGEPTAMHVDLDDFVFDVHARNLNEAGYVGHRYRMPLKVAKKVFGKNADVTATDNRIFNLEGDPRISLLGRTTVGGEDEEYEEFVDLWEVYMPRHRVVITLLDAQLSIGKEDPMKGKALRIQKWVGPDCGPYHFLGFATVPGNAMPKSPIQDLMDMHLSLNKILRKILRQAERQKELLLVPGRAVEDADRINKSNDGDATLCQNADQVKQANYGGPDQRNFQLFIALKDVFSWTAGNLETLGGLAPQSKTASQDQMLNANSSANISDMQQRTLGLVSSVVSALCWFWHHDPHTVMKTTFSPPGLPSIAVPRPIFPNNPEVHGNVPGRLVRNQSFEDMKIKVVPYSLQFETPQQRVSALNQFVTQVITPLMPLLQAQGIQFNVQAYLSKVAHYSDMPELEEIITIGEPPPAEGQGGPEAPGMPANTSREYVRRSLGGDSAGAKKNELSNALSATPSRPGEAMVAGA